MILGFDIPVIETYTQLGWVLLTVAGAVMCIWGCGGGLVRLERQDAAQSKQANVKKIADAATTPVAAPRRSEFDQLADLLASAGARAFGAVDVQARATLSLDSTEMAVNRLVADLSQVMVVPKKIPDRGFSRRPLVSAPQLPRPLVPLPNSASLAA